jgi:hypothetical protein
MSEALGVISVMRNTVVTNIFESLYLTKDKVIVLRMGKGGFLGWGVGNAILAWYRANDQDKYLAKLSPDELPELNDDDYVIPFSEIKKVELKKYGRGAKINIITNEKEYGWFARGLPDKKKPKFDDFQKILETVFSEKLSVSK